MFVCPRSYSLLAGFLEFGEPLEAAVVREVEEESDVKVRTVLHLCIVCVMVVALCVYNSMTTCTGRCMGRG